MPVIYRDNLDWIAIEDELVSLHLKGQIEENPIFLDKKNKILKYVLATGKSLPILKQDIKNNKLFNRRLFSRKSKKQSEKKSLTKTRYLWAVKGHHVGFAVGVVR